MTLDHYEFDAVVMGAGPAGSSAATVLAQAGFRVALLEREKFPRYQLGESLLPYCYFPLERLGLIDKMHKVGFVAKHSVQFVRPDGRVSTPFYFQEHLDHPAASTWQVERSAFDQLLVDHAVEAGVTFIEEIEARDLLYDSQETVIGVKARKDGVVCQFTAPLTVDATGRNALSAARRRWRKMDPALKKIALWTYFEGAQRDEGLDEGATTVAYLDGKNWCWYIPLRNDCVSVGVVGERESLMAESRDLETIFQREIQKNRWLVDHLAPGRQRQSVRVTSDFSYRSQHCAADGLVLVGDAFGFLDPVFSSGVLLALNSGVMAGEAGVAALNDKDVGAHRFRDYGAAFCEWIEAMRALVYAFYDEGFSFRKLFGKYDDLRHDVTDCLIGNLARDYGRLLRAMNEFADLPARVEHGQPLETVP